MEKHKLLTKNKTKELVRLEPIEKFAPVPKEIMKKGLAFPKDFKCGVVVDKQSSPRFFIFDTASLWDFLCALDEKLEEAVSAEEYVFHNPVGWLIDTIEEHLPLNLDLVSKLKKDLEGTKQSGLVSLEEIEHKLGLL